MELVFLAGQTMAIGIDKGSMELIILVAIEPCVDLPFAMSTILFWCGLVPGVWLLVFQPGGDTQL